MALHWEIMVEEPSMECLLSELLPKIIGKDFRIYPFQCKEDMLKELPKRLKGYTGWLPNHWRIVVLMDRDDGNCVELKKRLEKMAADAGIFTRTEDKSSWQLVNRIVVEELESWYFGDWHAVRMAYPKVGPTIPEKAPYRVPDQIKGGTWEALERLLKKAGYFSNGIRKQEIAREVGRFMQPERNKSHSFQVFYKTLQEG